MSLAGKSALITGSTGGLGRAIAEGLAAQGCNVALNGVVSDAEMAPAVAALRGRTASRRSTTAPICASPTPSRRWSRALPPPSAPSTSSSTMPSSAIRAGGDFPIERWEEALAVNLSAPFHTIRLTLPGMRARGFGRIVNLASPYSFKGTVNRVDYVTPRRRSSG